VTANLRARGEVVDASLANRHAIHVRQRTTCLRNVATLRWNSRKSSRSVEIEAREAGRVYVCLRFGQGWRATTGPVLKLMEANAKAIHPCGEPGLACCGI
jgi:hypothetical protein